jgi:hypothetical protein
VNDQDDAPVIRRGTWLHDGVVRREVRIIRQSTLYGSGDCADPSRIADDRDSACFGLLFEPSEKTDADRMSWLFSIVFRSIGRR